MDHLLGVEVKLVIPALGRQRLENSKFEASLGLHSEFKVSLSYIWRSCLKKQKIQNKNKKYIIDANIRILVEFCSHHSV
jgi:hypothetical protein